MTNPTSKELTEALCYEGEKDYQIDQLLDYLHYDPDTRSHPDWVARAQTAEAEVERLRGERDFHQRTSVRLGDINVARFEQLKKVLESWSLTGDAGLTVETSMPHLLDRFTTALKEDPDLAWSWHCNIAMPIMDRVDCSHTAANEAAADLMRHLFHIDIRSNSNWAITARPEEEPAQETEPKCADCGAPHFDSEPCPTAENGKGDSHA